VNFSVCKFKVIEVLLYRVILSVRMNNFTRTNKIMMHHTFNSLSKFKEKNESGTPYFIAHQKVLESNLKKWSSGDKQLQIAYSLKANYADKILQYFSTNCEFLEVGSLDEFELASHYISSKKILVNGPIYSKNDLSIICSSSAVLIIDSLVQLQTINRLQEQSETKFRLGVRIRMDGFPNSRFGIGEDEIDLFKLQLNTVSKLELLHCHYCDGFRTATSFGQRIIHIEQVRKREFPEVKHINIGGGFYSEMPEELKKQFHEPIPLIEDYVEEIQKHISEDITVTTEIGAGLVANAVDYICRVEDVKTVNGQLIVVTNGSKWDIKPNGSRKNLPLKVYSETLVKGKQCNIQVVGYTCMEDDVLFDDRSELPNIGDFLVFENCGAYAQSLSPDFIINRKKTY